MISTTILERIRNLFAPGASEHLDTIKDAFARGMLREPLRPMSDQELARIIREFRSVPVSEWTLAKLARRFIEVSGPRDR